MKVESAEAVTVIIPDGELRRASTGVIDSAVDQVLTTDVTAVVISFREVSALLSEGIRFLVSLSDKVKAAGKVFYIAELPPDVRYTLKITNLLSFLNHVDSLEDILSLYALQVEDLRALKTQSSPGPTPATAAPAETKKADTAKPEPHDAPSAQSPEATQPEVKQKLSFEKLVSRHIPGRLALDVISYFIQHGVSVAEVKAVASSIGVKEKPVAKMMAELAGRGVLKKLGTTTYNYTAAEEIDKRIRDFIHDIRDHSKQAKLTALLLAADH